MSWHVIIALAVFMLAFIWAAIIEHWRKLISTGKKPYGSAQQHDADVNVTLIVPARNAAQTIVPLLQDLYAQNYPKTHCKTIVIDDGSTDNTVALATAFIRTWPQLRVETLTDAFGKKAAITQGVSMATGELILITDADARCDPQRVSSCVDLHRKEPEAMIVLPVRTECDTSVLGRLQREEQNALQGATAGSGLSGSAMLANGANMAFTRKAFFEVGGYAGDKWASGDDVFLLKRMQKFGVPVVYNLDPYAVVTVQAEPTWKAFFQQRLRWTGKMRASGTGSFPFGNAMALLFPWILLAYTIWVVLHVKVGESLFYTSAFLFGAWVLWIFPPVRLSQEMERFFTSAEGRGSGNYKIPFIRPVLSLFAFSLYAPLIALASLVIRPRWKGRKV